MPTIDPDLTVYESLLEIPLTELKRISGGEAAKYTQKLYQTLAHNKGALQH